MESNSVPNHTSDQQNRMTAKRESDLLITGMITDWIGRHNVLLLINQNYEEIREANKAWIERWTILKRRLLKIVGSLSNHDDDAANFAIV